MAMEACGWMEIDPPSSRQHRGRRWGIILLGSIKWAVEAQCCVLGLTVEQAVNRFGRTFYLTPVGLS
jgi:hypothetical protein